MKPRHGFLMLVVMLASCRDYNLNARLTDQDGLIPPDQFARYGREQAQEMAIAREYAYHHDGSAPEELARQAEAATSYARTLPDVIDAGADPLGLRVRVQFNSGWRTMVTPLDDGKRGSETAGLPSDARPGPRR